MHSLLTPEETPMSLNTTTPAEAADPIEAMIAGVAQQVAAVLAEAL